MTATIDAPTLRLTDSAIGKIQQLLDEEGNRSLKLRVFVTGGGCSGFIYGFAFEERDTEGDSLIEQDGVGVLIDPTSIAYLAGAQVDFEENIEGARFIIRNPNAKTTCGCGTSFSV